MTDPGPSDAPGAFPIRLAAVDEVWEEAKRRTFAVYAGSASLHYLQRCVELFEQTNKVKYHTDFKEFVFESSQKILTICRTPYTLLAGSV